MLCLFVWFSVSTSFAQSQATPTGQQTQQAPPPATNSTPSSIPVNLEGTLKTKDGASQQRSPEPITETPSELTDKQSVSQSPEERDSLTYGVEIDFNSNYVFRGLLLDDGPVMLPSAWISAFGFTLTTWGNYAFTSRSGGSGLRTGGLLLTYNRDWEKLRMEAALDANLGRQSSGIEPRSTMEGSLMLSYPAGPLRIFTTHAFDVLAYRGSYFGEAGVECERQVTKNTEFKTSIRSGWASAKFNDVYIGVNKSAFNYVGVDGSLTYNLGRRLYFKPHIEFSSITDRRLREQLELSPGMPPGMPGMSPGMPPGMSLTRSPSTIVNFGIAFGFYK